VLVLFFVSYAVSIGVLLYASASTVAEAQAWMQHSYVWELQANDLSPNIGLWWYFFTELFGRFRPYFIFLFNVHPYIYVLPLTIQLGAHRPVLLGQLLFAVAALFRSYPDLSGLAVVACCACMHPLTLERMEGVAHTSLGVVGPLALLPVMSFMWLEAGSGNADYCYFQGLMFHLFCGALVLEWLLATVRRDRLAKQFHKHPNAKWWVR
jgi:phosphatidylinositol glycan class U